MVNIGQIAGTHGYNGTVKIIPLGNYPERFKKLKSVTVVWAKGKKTQVMGIENVRVTPKQVLIKFREIPSMEEARAYNGGYLQVPDDEVWPLPEGHFYYFQLEGLHVIDEEKGELGIMTDVIETGANDVYVVRREGKKDLLLPAIPQVIRNIDLKGQTMLVHLLPGLEDL